MLESKFGSDSEIGNEVFQTKKGSIKPSYQTTGNK